ncbi:Glycoside hydrolase, 38 vacuolar alpha mannosidase [Conoideocrella luteorostrata]|uniref:Glycoside hydrolase, 38 vacuolar alpha mannosidase n=1 Tax=Conoideocrella luteorostrata TaxID=1105319 RepID=A0AAJ0CI02_9HYPO|nr:Glycoside hydrolase, 38 vacuolar alpha mannosidase [Conoideocrella luteorostrata]
MKVINAFDVNQPSSILRCREISKEIVGPDVDSHEVYDLGKEPVVYGIGHCHIDSCWLWPFAETKRKVVRSWASQCDLMDRYPELHFACSQAQQYQWLKQLYPEAFERVKRKVRDGRFHPIGGSWVEHDTNMPSGESLVHQFFYGQRFFEAEFGSRCRTFWLPDTFGYSSQLPQLCRLAGMDRFMTQNLSWNNINNFPHTTFIWVSPDGSQVMGMVGGGAPGIRTFRRCHSNLNITTATLDGNDATFHESYALLKSMIQKYNLNGIDLDVEESMSQDGIERLVRQLHYDFDPSFLVTLAPVAAALSGANTLGKFDYKTLEQHVAAYTLFYNTQFYNGFGSMANTNGFDRIISAGWDPKKIVAGQLTSPDNEHYFNDMGLLVV